jgi:hypothetical protein
MDLSFIGDATRHSVDRGELERLRRKHGSKTESVLRQRASDPKLKERDRQHWDRLLKLWQKEQRSPRNLLRRLLPF